eukprot:364640-Chlamydomonas_euryale.AAC.22
MAQCMQHADACTAWCNGRAMQMHALHGAKVQCMHACMHASTFMRSEERGQGKVEVEISVSTAAPDKPIQA